jgi:hypothetical protein
VRGRVGGVLGIMAGLLQRSVASSYLSPVVVSLPANGSVSRGALSVRGAPKWGKLSICRASSESGSAEVRPEEEAKQERMVGSNRMPRVTRFCC